MPRAIDLAGQPSQGNARGRYGHRKGGLVRDGYDLVCLRRGQSVPGETPLDGRQPTTAIPEARPVIDATRRRVAALGFGDMPAMKRGGVGR